MSINLSILLFENKFIVLVMFNKVYLLFRLDFERFSITGPEPVNHQCDNDQFIVSGSNPVPVICGMNSGSHSMCH